VYIKIINYHYMRLVLLVMDGWMYDPSHIVQTNATAAELSTALLLAGVLIHGDRSIDQWGLITGASALIDQPGCNYLGICQGRGS
jgi:hypothetical protein